MNIILTGMRGVGKSSIGRKLADELGLELVEMDELIESKEGAAISDIVAEQGWDYFRDLEHELCVELAERDGMVISTGGGTMIFERNAEVLKGKVVLLKCAIGVSAARIYGDVNRPSLGGEKSAVEELSEVWEERKASYEAVADFEYRTDNGKSLDEQVEEISNLIK